MEYWLEPQILHGRLLLGRNKCNKEVFPNDSAYICDFHRKQAWNRWARSSKNKQLNYKEQQVLRNLLKHVAYAHTMSSYNAAVVELRKSSVYKAQKNVQDYVENIWVSPVPLHKARHF